ncbi:MAG: CDP-glycerol glycerophosphotransferase family protein [Candidatus Thermoplasmatota archaeon]
MASWRSSFSLAALVLRETIATTTFYASRLVPRDPDLWIFGAWHGRRYSDNPKHLFLHVRENAPGIRAVWITRSPAVVLELRAAGHEAYLTRDPRGWWLSARAACVVVNHSLDDVNKFLLGGAKRVQLWHGSAIKKLGINPDHPHQDSNRITRAMSRWRVRRLRAASGQSYDLITAASLEVQRVMRTVWPLSRDAVQVLGYPRTDVLFSTTRPRVPWLEEVRSKNAFQRLVLYAPTFRAEGGTRGLFRASRFDASRIGAALARIDAVLIVKAHFEDACLRPDGDAGGGRVVYVDDADVPDVADLLPHVDVLITDYSGIYLDYLLLDRPVLFAAFDLEEYEAFDHWLAYPYDEVTWGTRLRDWNELAGAIEKIDWAAAPPAKQRMVRDRFNTHRDGRSAKRVREAIERLLR